MLINLYAIIDRTDERVANVKSALYNQFYLTVDNPTYKYYYSPFSSAEDMHTIHNRCYTMKYLSMEAKTDNIIGYMVCDIDMISKVGRACGLISYDIGNREYIKDVIKFLKLVRDRGMKCIRTKFSTENPFWKNIQTERFTKFLANHGIYIHEHAVLPREIVARDLTVHDAHYVDILLN